MDPLKTHTQLFVNATQQNGSALIPNTLFDAYHDLGLSEGECLVLLHIMRLHQSLDDNTLTCVTYLVKKTKRTTAEMERTLKGLVNRKFLRIVKEVSVAMPDHVSLDPLYTKLLAWTPVAEVETSEPDLSPLFRAFENYFGHMNAMEYVFLNRWLKDDHWAPEVLLEALKIVALKRIRNFKYMEAILRNWKKKGFTTLSQIRNDQAQFDHLARTRADREAEQKERQTAERKFYRGRREKKPSTSKRQNIGLREGETLEEMRKRYDRLIE